jgi:hypothetical protein
MPLRRDWHDHFIDHDRRHHDGLLRAERRRQDELLYDAALDSGDSDMGWDGIVPAIQAGRYAIPKGEKLDITVASAAGAGVVVGILSKSIVAALGAAGSVFVLGAIFYAKVQKT